MTNDWLNNSDATDNVRRLLHKMGIPLEIKVSRIVEKFDRWFDYIQSDVSYSNGRILYGGIQSDDALREIDCGVTIQTTIYPEIAHEDYGNDFYVNIEANVLIECKHRDGLALFGFPYQTLQHRFPTNPILSELSHTSLLRTLERVSPLSKDISVCAIGMLENMQKSPRIADEQLIYKASAGIYDYIRFMVSPMIDTEVSPIIEELEILNRFLDETEKRLYDPWTTAQNWIQRESSEDLLHNFNMKFYANTHNIPIQSDVLIFIPVICVDAPLYFVSTDDDGEIQNIEPTDLLVTASRLPNWPGPFEYHLQRSTPEALVTIVNVEYLEEYLERVTSWIGDIRDQCNLRLNENEDRIPLEMHFLASVHSKLLRDHHRNWYWKIK